MGPPEPPSNVIGLRQRSTPSSGNTGESDSYFRWFSRYLPPRSQKTSPGGSLHLLPPLLQTHSAHNVGDLACSGAIVVVRRKSCQASSSLPMRLISEWTDALALAVVLLLSPSDPTVSVLVVGVGSLKRLHATLLSPFAWAHTLSRPSTNETTINSARIRGLRMMPLCGVAATTP